jgi:DNA-directed RNA polymerase specialized sigma24 family protein
VVVLGPAEGDGWSQLDGRRRADRHGDALPERRRVAIGQGRSRGSEPTGADRGDDKGKRGDDPHGVLLGMLDDDDEQLLSMTRMSTPSVTPEWTVWWPLMRKRLLRFLQSRGISPYAAEDAVQDVAERLLTRQVPHTDVDDLMRWCMTVARNSAIDQHRRVRRSVPLDYRDADADDGSELVDTVEARMRLARVLRVLGDMPYEDVRCVMASIDDDEVPEVASPALRARRHRLRRRLSELVGGFGLIGVAARVLRPRASRTTLGLGSAAMASVALVTAVVGGAPQLGTTPHHLRMHLAPTTVTAEPVADRSGVVHRSAPTHAGVTAGHAAAPTVAGHPGSASDTLDVRTPDKRGTVDVQARHRRPSDRGMLCVGGLKYVPDSCITPTLTAPHVPPAP